MRQTSLFKGQPANLKRSRSKSALSTEWKIAYTVSALAALVVIGALYYLYGAHSSLRNSSSSTGEGSRQSPSEQAQTQSVKAVHSQGFHSRWSELHKAASSPHQMDNTVVTPLPLPDEEATKGHVVVIGGGLAGCAAALSALNQSGSDVQIFLVEKMPKLVGGHTLVHLGAAAPVKSLHAEPCIVHACASPIACTWSATSMRTQSSLICYIGRGLLLPWEAVTLYRATCMHLGAPARARCM